MTILPVVRARSGDLYRSPLADSMLRGSMLVDLTFTEMIVLDSDKNVALNLSTSGFLPADEALKSLARHGSWTMEKWLRRGPRLQKLLAMEWVREGWWTAGFGSMFHPYTRFHERSFGGPMLDSAKVAQLLLARVDGRPQDFAGSLILNAAAALGPEYPKPFDDQAFVRCGSAEWIVRDVVGYLQYALPLNRAAARGSAQANLGNFWR